MRRRWGYVISLTLPSGAVERDEWPSRYWTRAGAQRAADEFMADAREIPEIAHCVRAEVEKLGPMRPHDDDSPEDLR